MSAKKSDVIEITNNIISKLLQLICVLYKRRLIFRRRTPLIIYWLPLAKVTK